MCVVASPRTTACRAANGQQFSWSWTCGGEPSGTIKVRTEMDAVVLIYRARSFLAEWKSRGFDFCPANFMTHS
jgi:hypothetical protein